MSAEPGPGYARDAARCRAEREALLRRAHDPEAQPCLAAVWAGLEKAGAAQAYDEWAASLDAQIRPFYLSQGFPAVRRQDAKNDSPARHWPRNLAKEPSLADPLPDDPA